MGKNLEKPVHRLVAGGAGKGRTLAVKRKLNISKQGECCPVSFTKVKDVMKNGCGSERGGKRVPFTTEGKGSLAEARPFVRKEDRRVETVRGVSSRKRGNVAKRAGSFARVNKGRSMGRKKDFEA